MIIETNDRGEVALGSLFRVVAYATFVFNMTVLLPLLAITFLAGGSLPGPFDLPSAAETLPSAVAALVILPVVAALAGTVAGLQNAVVVCVGVWVPRAWRRWRTERARRS